MIRVRFFTLSGKFTTAKTEEYPSTTEALQAVRAYAEAAGYTMVKMADWNEEPDCLSFTATTPGGRAGRNVAEVEDWGAEDPGLPCVST